MLFSIVIDLDILLIQIDWIGLVKARHIGEMSSCMTPQSICAVGLKGMACGCDRNRKYEVLRILLFSQL